MPLTTSGVAWLRRSVYDDLISQSSRHAPDETGGLLLGYRHSPTEIVITDAIGPGPNADHGPTGFEPDSEWQTRELARRYSESDRRIRYLGDWHSHPGGSTTLSRTDRRTMRAIARYADARCPEPVMAVLAGGDPWQTAIRQWARRSLIGHRPDALLIRTY